MAVPSALAAGALHAKLGSPDDFNIVLWQCLQFVPCLHASPLKPVHVRCWKHPIPANGPIGQLCHKLCRDNLEASVTDIAVSTTGYILQHCVSRSPLVSHLLLEEILMQRRAW